MRCCCSKKSVTPHPDPSMPEVRRSLRIAELELKKFAKSHATNDKKTILNGLVQKQSDLLHKYYWKVSSTLELLETLLRKSMENHHPIDVQKYHAYYDGIRTLCWNYRSYVIILFEKKNVESLTHYLPEVEYMNNIHINLECIVNRIVKDKHAEVDSFLKNDFVYACKHLIHCIEYRMK